MKSRGTSIKATVLLLIVAGLILATLLWLRARAPESSPESSPPVSAAEAAPTSPDEPGADPAASATTAEATDVASVFPWKKPIQNCLGYKWDGGSPSRPPLRVAFDQMLQNRGPLKRRDVLSVTKAVHLPSQASRKARVDFKPSEAPEKAKARLFLTSSADSDDFREVDPKGPDRALMELFVNGPGFQPMPELAKEERLEWDSGATADVHWKSDQIVELSSTDEDSKLTCTATEGPLSVDCRCSKDSP